ncbi:hypothetical protein IL306_001689 [Fusarium sp. DS 682]|nr:hypothetical protein IL306_001689 [Fusarium sp. DS 682]
MKVSVVAILTLAAGAIAAPAPVPVAEAAPEAGGYATYGDYKGAGEDLPSYPSYAKPKPKPKPAPAPKKYTNYGSYNYKKYSSYGHYKREAEPTTYSKYGSYPKKYTNYGSYNYKNHKVHRYDRVYLPSHTPNPLQAAALTQTVCRPPRDTAGRLVPSDNAFAYHTGNIKVKAGQSDKNAIGAAENALLLAEVVEKFLAENITPELQQNSSSILTTMGDIQGLTKSVNTIRPEHAPEAPSDQFGSALRAIHDSGGSARSIARDALLRLRDPDSDEDLLAFFDRPLGEPQEPPSVVSQPWPDMPFIIADSITIGSGSKAIYSLIATDETIIFLSRDVAKTSGAPLLSLPHETLPSTEVIPAFNALEAMRYKVPGKTFPSFESASEAWQPRVTQPDNDEARTAYEEVQQRWKKVDQKRVENDIDLWESALGWAKLTGAKALSGVTPEILTRDMEQLLVAPPLLGLDPYSGSPSSDRMY